MNKLVEFFGNLIIKFWCAWSNKRFEHTERFSTKLAEEDLIRNFNDIKLLVRKCYSNYKWTADDISQLGDAITPPPENYNIYKNNILLDDCDGFHSLVYHILTNNGIKCYLFTVNTIDGGHCVLLFKYNDSWFVNDYTKIYNGFEKAIDAINNYNEHYVDRYKAKSKVFFNGFVKYNYTTGKFSQVNINELEE